MRALVALGVAVAILVAGCGNGSEGDGDGAGETPAVERGGCAHLVEADLTAQGAGTYRVAATVRSADTGWDKYADAWEVRAPDGKVLGTRVLAHPHENEQPFTRSLDGVSIPDDVDAVVIVAHDSVLGFCGDTVTVEVPR